MEYAMLVLLAIQIATLIILHETNKSLRRLWHKMWEDKK